MNKFLAEILEQPKSFEVTLDFYCSPEGENRLKKIRSLFDEGDPRQIIFTGMGSSYFTSYAAACLFNSLGIHSYAINTSELLYYHMSSITEDTQVVCVSQSGESFEVVKLLEMLPPEICCIGITNEENSSLSKKATASLLSCAGREEMTSTKTYTTIILVIAILGWYLAGKWRRDKIESVKKLISNSERLLSNHSASIDKTYDFLGDIDFIQFIGRGPSYATAKQSELMFKEAAKTPAAGTLGGEFRHGPIEMVKPGFKSILFAAEGSTYAQCIKITDDIAGFGGKVLLITNKNPGLSNKNVSAITLDEPDEYLFSIPGIMPVQLMINHLASAKGFEPGDFIHGGKITSTE